MATIAASRIGSVVPRPVTIVTGNAKKLEEVRAILSSVLFLFSCRSCKANRKLYRKRKLVWLLSRAIL
ncbi:hypothetical protein SDJN02_09960, partial [Cucurbita argyrosperma subsp. argyrosperma]